VRGIKGMRTAEEENLAALEKQGKKLLNQVQKFSWAKLRKGPVPGGGRPRGGPISANERGGDW